MWSAQRIPAAVSLGSLGQKVSCANFLDASLGYRQESKNFSASFIRMTRIGELGTTLAVTINRTHAAKKYNVRRRYVPPKLRFLQEPHGVTSRKTAFLNIPHKLNRLEYRRRYLGDSVLHEICTNLNGINT
jgi:hypothetical protein